MFQVKETNSLLRFHAREPAKSLVKLLSMVRMPQFALLLILLTFTPYVFREWRPLWYSVRAPICWGPWQNGGIYAAMGSAQQLHNGSSWSFYEAPERRLNSRSILVSGCSLSSGYADLSFVFVLIVMGVSLNNPSLNSLISSYAGTVRGALTRFSDEFLSCTDYWPAWVGLPLNFWTAGHSRRDHYGHYVPWPYDLGVQVENECKPLGLYSALPAHLLVKTFMIISSSK